MAGINNPVAVTMGDPAGIGSEIIAKTFADPGFSTSAIVIGDPAILSRAVQQLGLAIEIRRIAHPGDARPGPRVIDLIAGSDLPVDLPVGAVDARAGTAAYSYIDLAVKLALNGDVSAIATAPINKEALKAAGIPYPGHTEILADMTGSPDHAMMLFNEELRVILVTVHCALRAAIDRLSVELELATIRLAVRAARQLGIEQPRVAVAGLNPHAGESGLFGEEDEAVIRPAVELASDEGIDASGPWPADTVFMQARQGRFDIVVAQYHDQGLIPVKYLGIDQGVNVTVGLPFIRTSVDHGTAFDIAGTGKASHASLKNSIEKAAQMSLAMSQSARPAAENS